MYLRNFNLVFINRNVCSLMLSQENRQKSRSVSDHITGETMSHFVHHVTDKDDFDGQLKEAGSKLVIVDFYAQWCGPCKLIAPEIDRLSKVLPDVIFLKVDVDEIEELASEFEISSMPTIIAFLEGEKVGTMLGANADKLKQLINNHKK